MAGWRGGFGFVVVAAAGPTMVTATAFAVVAVVALVVGFPFGLAVFVVVKVVCGLCCWRH
jgi:hypothetical protein